MEYGLLKKFVRVSLIFLPTFAPFTRSGRTTFYCCANACLHHLPNNYFPMNAYRPKAFIFDLNGTMIDDMQYHTQAWFGILNNDLGTNMSWDAVKQEMYGKNEELLLRVFGPGRFTPDEMHHWSLEKERRYQKAFQPHLKLIAGLDGFLKTAWQSGVQQAVGTAAIPMNVDFVLDSLQIRRYFSAVVTADDVARSKPDPETFLKAARQLGIEPQQCLVFEDAPKGVEAAQNAGMQAVVLTTMHAEGAFTQYENIFAFVADYTDPVLETLFQNAAVS
jgi:HAD superfamily hydrolase (TIGR01509 family)